MSQLEWQEGRHAKTYDIRRTRHDQHQRCVHSRRNCFAFLCRYSAPLLCPYSAQGQRAVGQLPMLSTQLSSSVTEKLPDDACLSRHRFSRSIDNLKCRQTARKHLPHKEYKRTTSRGPLSCPMDNKNVGYGPYPQKESSCPTPIAWHVNYVQPCHWIYPANQSMQSQHILLSKCCFFLGGGGDEPQKKHHVAKKPTAVGSPLR